MKTEKRLEEKITEAEEFLPGVGESLQPISERRRNVNFRENPTDVECLDVGKYKVVVVKYESRYWKDVRGGVGTTEWAMLCYSDGEGEIKTISTSKIATRDQYDSRFDKHHMLYHDYVGLEALADDKVEVAWVKHDGTKGPIYTIKLE
jgi:hypothetical protein